VLFVIVLLRSIWMFTKFDTPWLMIQGGGAETYIRTLPIYTYMRTFAYYEAGLGSAMAVGLSICNVDAVIGSFDDQNSIASA
jgi:multiple sugar transport system permease protein